MCFYNGPFYTVMHHSQCFRHIMKIVSNNLHPTKNCNHFPCKLCATVWYSLGGTHTSKVWLRQPAWYIWLLDKAFHFYKRRTCGSSSAVAQIEHIPCRIFPEQILHHKHNDSTLYKRFIKKQFCRNFWCENQNWSRYTVAVCTVGVHIFWFGWKWLVVVAKVSWSAVNNKRVFTRGSVSLHKVVILSLPIHAVLRAVAPLPRNTVLIYATFFVLGPGFVAAFYTYRA